MDINDIVQTIAEARVDARSLSEFVFKPAGFKVTRRLAPTIDTLQFYIDRLNSLNGDFSSSVSAALSSLSSSVAEADGKVAYIESTVQDAINNTAIEGGVLADTFVTAAAYGSGSIARTQREINAERVSVHDFGAIGDGTLHTVAEWTVVGSRIYFPDLAAIQEVYPHVTALTDSVDWTAIQACIDYCRSTNKMSTSSAGKNYIIDKTVVIRSNVEFNYSTFTIDKNYVGAAVYLGNDPDSPSLLNGLRAKLPFITSDRSYLEPWVAGTKGVTIEGIRNSVITFEGVRGFETNIFGHSKNGVTGYSTANTFIFNGAYVASKTNVHILTENDGWFNQCQWYNGHFGVLSQDHTRYPNIRNIVMQKIGITGNNPPNGHTFTGCNMEGEGFEYTIQQDYGGKEQGFLSNNRWVNCRFEASKRIHIEETAINDLFVASHMSEGVEFTGKVPSIIGQYNRGHSTIFLGAPKSGTRATNKSLHASGSQSGTNMINTWGREGETINSGISGNGTYLVYNGADKSKLFPIMEFGKDGFYPAFGMGGGDSEITERIQRKGLNNWEFNFNLYPTTTNTHSLGSSGQRLKDVYTEHLSTNRLSVWGAAAPTSKPIVAGLKTPTTIAEQKVVTDSLIAALVNYGLITDSRT